MKIDPKLVQAKISNAVRPKYYFELRRVQPTRDEIAAFLNRGYADFDTVYERLLREEK